MTEKSVPDKPITTARSGRSPAYPAFGLAFAIEKLHLFYNAQRNNAVSIEAAAESMGYQTAKSGAAQRAIAALISYGLIAEEGGGASRKVKITDRGRKILLLPENDPEKLDLIREAAVGPKIYKDMLTEWPENLPSDKELSKYLTFTKSYHEDTVPSLIKVFRETYDFAKLAFSKYPQDRDHDELGETNDQGANDQHKYTPVPPRGETPDTTDVKEKNQAQSRILHIPITGGRVAILQTPKAISDEDYGFLQRYLEVFKGAIVTEKPLRVSEVQGQPIPEVRSGRAIWHTKEHDLPITVIGYLGHQNGRHYASTEGSTSGVPLDEIQYD